MPIALATSVGYLAAVVVGFVLNATLTFEKGRITSTSQALKYTFLYAIGYLYNLVMIVGGVDYAGQKFVHMIVLVSLTWPIFSFLIAKNLVFR